MKHIAIKLEKSQKLERPLHMPHLLSSTVTFHTDESKWLFNVKTTLNFTQNYTQIQKIDKLYWKFCV